MSVIVGQRPGSKNYDLAVEHGFEPVSAAEAAAAGDVVNLLLPDEVQGDVYRNDVAAGLKPGDVLMCSHGFNIHFNQIAPPAGVGCALVAPKGPGHLVRSEYVAGGGVPCLIAVEAHPGHRPAADQGDRPGLRQRRRRDPAAG